MIWSDDLVSDYWMWFAGKIFSRELIEATEPTVSALASFAGGGGEPPRVIDAGGAPVVIAVKPGVTVYGHWLLDTLPMIWHLYDVTQKGIFDDWRQMKFLISSRTPNWARNMLRILFDIDDAKIIEFDDNTEVIKVSNSIVPGLMRSSPLISSEMNRFCDFVIERTFKHRSGDINLPKEFFISRADFAHDANRTLINWREVQGAAEACGMAIVMPERMSWPDQIAMFAAAKVVVGEYGSGLHNTIFGRPDCIPVVFTSVKMNWSQSAIAGLRGQRMIYVQPESQEWRGVHGVAYNISPASMQLAVKFARDAQSDTGALMNTEISRDDEKSSYAMEKRLEGLAQAGLLQHFVNASSHKVSVFPESHMPPPPPLLATIGLNDAFVAKHNRVQGAMGATGYYVFENHYASRSGTIFDSQRRICYDNALISPYWMWYLSKVINKHVYGTEPEDNDAQASPRLSAFLRGELGCNREIDEATTVVNLIKPGQQVYGHWLLDVLPGVWTLFRAREMGLLDGDLRYLVAAGTPRWGLELLNTVFDIKPEDLLFMDDFNEVIKINKMIVPSLVRSSPVISPIMNNFVDFIKEKVIPMAKMAEYPKRIFISRDKYATEHNKKLLGSADVAECFETRGFTVVQPEAMAWPDQVAMFAQAEVIAGEFGSGTHNALFASSNAISLILLHLKHNWNQSAIAALRKQRLIYVAPSEQTRTGIGAGVTFSFDEGALAEAITVARKALGDTGAPEQETAVEGARGGQEAAPIKKGRKPTLLSVAVGDVRERYDFCLASQKAYADRYDLECVHRTEVRGEHDEIFSRIAYAVYAVAAGLDVMVIDPHIELTPHAPSFPNVLAAYPKKHVFYLPGKDGGARADVLILRGGDKGVAYKFLRAILSEQAEGSLAARLSRLVMDRNFVDRCLALGGAWSVPVSDTSQRQPLGRMFGADESADEATASDDLFARAAKSVAEVRTDSTATDRERALAADLDALLARIATQAREQA
jgi:capsular polysaccharide biosynthesis protein